MANHKSARKRALQNEQQRMRNRKVKTQLKNEVKKMRLSAADTSQEITADQLNAVKSTIAKAGKKGVIHKKTAARKISRLSKLVNSVKA